MLSPLIQIVIMSLGAFAIGAGIGVLLVVMVDRARSKY